MSIAKLDTNRYVLGSASVHIGFLNCERISERSHIHGWAVEPHYHEGLDQLFVFAEGSVQGLVETRRLQIACPAMVWLPALCNHAFQYPENMQGWVLTVPTTEIARLVQRTSWAASWISAPQILHGQTHPGLLETAVSIVMDVEKESKGRDEAHNTVLESLLLLLFAQLHRGLTHQAGGQQHISSRRTELVRQFQNFLDQDMPDMRSVSEYARMLSVTPTHLSRVTSAVTGLTAVEIIQDRILGEAKRKLTFTDLPVTRIAYDLKFSTPSYFTRFFSRMTSETPLQFRKRSRSSKQVMPNM